MNALHIIDGPMRNKSFKFENAIINIGRSSGSTIQIKDPSISRKHLKIIWEGDKYFLEDLGSRNGTRINGVLIVPGEVIEAEAGQPISIGKTLISLGEKPTPDDTNALYIGDLYDSKAETAGNLLYKDRRITSRGNLELIYEVSTLLMQSLNIREICEKIIDFLFFCVKRIDSGGILLIDKKSGKIKEIMARSIDNKRVKLKYSQTIVHRVLDEGKSILIPDTSQEKEINLSESIEMMRIKSIICVPLISKSETLGVLYVHSLNVPGGFQKDDLLLLTGLSFPAALAIESGLLDSQRKQAEETLRREKEKFHTLIETCPIGMSLVRDDGCYEYINPKFFRIFGYTLDDVPTGRAWFRKAFPDPEDREEAISLWIQEIQESNGMGGMGIEPRTFHVTCKDGSIKDIIFRPIKINDNHHLIIYEDMTEIKLLKNKLLQAQKMEAIGTLAGGVAHEYNNALAGVLGNLELIQMNIREADKIEKNIEPMKEQVRRMTTLTSQLLAYARGGTYQQKTTNLNEFVRDSLPLIKHSIDPSIKVKMELHEYTSYIMVDLTQMQMLLSAVFKNASEAIEGKGLIRVVTSHETIDEDYCKDHPGLKPGIYACMTIKDNGKGMSEKTRCRVFEPFFTTKFQGRGLGLAASYGIIKSHEGYIAIDSENGHGTCVRVFLPSVEREEISV